MMRRTMISCLLVLGLLAAGGAARADDASHRRAAADLLDAAGAATQFKSALDQMLQLQLRASPQIAPYEEVMRRFFEKYIGYEAIKADLIELYVAEFTESELSQIAAFYRTPTGAKTVSRLPIVMANGLQLGERRVRANQPELVRMLEEERQRRGLPK